VYVFDKVEGAGKRLKRAEEEVGYMAFAYWCAANHEEIKEFHMKMVALLVAVCARNLVKSGSWRTVKAYLSKARLWIRIARDTRLRLKKSIVCIIAGSRFARNGLYRGVGGFIAGYDIEQRKRFVRVKKAEGCCIGRATEAIYTKFTGARQAELPAHLSRLDLLHNAAW
jgi:hypothetical protein